MIPNTALVNSLPRNILAQKRARTSTPKSRGGCIACKKMHLKCDEGKPTCSRCDRAHRECQYSGLDPQPGCPVVSQQRTILPKPNVSGLEVTGKLYMQPRATSLEPSEVPYFDMFRYQMRQDFASTHCTLFWNRVIPREAMRDDCVRSSVLGVGALILSFRRLGSEPFLGPFGETGDKAHQSAIRYHARAIKGLQDRMQRGFHTISRRNVLINMFLLLLFELLHGNTKAADRMLSSSVELLRQRKDQLLEEVSSQYRPQRQPLYLAVSNDEGLEEAEIILPRLQVFCSLNSPFFPLQKRCWARLQSRPTPSAVPSPTTSFGELGAMWNSFTTRAVVFVVKAMQELVASGHTRDLEPYLDHQAAFLQQLGQWEEAILQRYEQETNAIQLQTLKVFHMGQKVVFILLNCCLDTTELGYDKFGHVFQDIIDTTHALAPVSRGMSRIEVILDIYFLPVLNFVSQKCRDTAVRQEALDLFEKMTSSMGGWEARASLLARRQLMALEERGRTATGEIPADSRYIWSDATWNESQSALEVVFTRASPNPFGVRDTENLAIELAELIG
ncbi:uncharacterized protein BKA55DRAFT_523994 [Fusarium redolens]|uniref:Zn(2)-C6 fungal-type domain-containing protein n=1 Tax=Fusarium redolens TaxID=48865 RepID=A0A9P9G220_FUSRE|nr:uncharacterized protein BKA55DRAFT_523994 [Fusarium redolens]KAH7231775.1 hypothetical protein BKA55DRAFT_523994 [Fusarium redolens]